MSFVLLAALLSLTAAAVIAVRWARADGGPGHRPPPRAEDRWSDLPSRPYAD